MSPVSIRSVILGQVCLFAMTLFAGTDGTGRSEISGKKHVAIIYPESLLYSFNTWEQFSEYVPDSGYEIYFVSSDKKADEAARVLSVPESHHCRVSFPLEQAGQPHSEIGEIRRCLQKLSGTRSAIFDYLITPGSEEGVYLGGRLRSESGIPSGLRLRDVEKFTNKLQMKNALPGHILTAAYRNISAISPGADMKEFFTRFQEHGVVVKPSQASGATGVTKIFTDDELDAFISACSVRQDCHDYIIEQYITGETMRIDGFVLNGRVVLNFPMVVSPSCYDWYIKGIDQFQFSDFSAERRESLYLPFSQSVVDALNYKNGVFHLEAFQVHNPDAEFGFDLYFLEIAARPGGGSEVLQKYYGYDYGLLYFLDQLDIRMTPEIQKYEPEFATIHIASLLQTRDQHFYSLSLNYAEGVSRAGKYTVERTDHYHPESEKPVKIEKSHWKSVQEISTIYVTGPDRGGVNNLAKYIHNSRKLNAEYISD